MPKYEHSYVNILSASKDTIFCFFRFSKAYIGEYEQIYGENSWKTTCPILKLYYIENGVRVEKRTIVMDEFAESHYLTLDNSDIDLFVELGRINREGEYSAAATSNILTIPRSFHTAPVEAYYINAGSSAASIPSTVQNDKQPQLRQFMNEYLQNQDLTPGSSW